MGPRKELSKFFFCPVVFFPATATLRLLYINAFTFRTIFTSHQWWIVRTCSIPQQMVYGSPMGDLAWGDSQWTLAKSLQTIFRLIWILQVWWFCFEPQLQPKFMMHVTLGSVDPRAGPSDRYQFQEEGFRVSAGWFFLQSGKTTVTWLKLMLMKLCFPLTASS